MAHLKDPSLPYYMRRLIWCTLTSVVIALILMVNSFSYIHNNHSNETNNINLKTVELEVVKNTFNEQTPALGKLIRADSDFNKNSLSSSVLLGNHAEQKGVENFNAYNQIVPHDKGEQSTITYLNNVNKIKFTEITHNYTKIYSDNSGSNQANFDEFLATITINNHHNTTTTKTIKVEKNNFVSLNKSRKQSKPANAIKTLDLPPLLLDRRKRYLVFPESSSFQMIFDLIIGVVDYTKYAILGITCAVAWELPSKPPSEIVEDVRQKLYNGTLGLQRRNDTITEETYVSSGQLFNHTRGTWPAYNDYVLEMDKYNHGKPQTTNYYTPQHSDKYEQKGSFTSHYYNRPVQSWTNDKVANFNYKWNGKDENANWWQQNKQRIQNDWQQQQLKWQNPNSNNSPWKQNYYTARTGMENPVYKHQYIQNNNYKARKAESRHYIHQIFGKRRRRRRDLNEMELAHEKVHIREHLTTRNKLFSKIEKVFKS